MRRGPVAVEACGRRSISPGSVDPAEVPGLWPSMDAAVAPYPNLGHFYFSPLKVYEYMAAGRAVVASRIGRARRPDRGRGDGTALHARRPARAWPGRSFGCGPIPPCADRLGGPREPRSGEPHLGRDRGRESSSWRAIDPVVTARSRRSEPRHEPSRERFTKACPASDRSSCSSGPAAQASAAWSPARSLALLAEVSLGTLEPWPLKFIFDNVLGSQHRGR